MKRLLFLLFSISLIFTIASCEDSSGKYSEPFFTDQMINAALIDVVKTAKDSACAQTANEYYDHTPIKFPENLSFLQDSLLEKHPNSKYLIDSFLVRVNRTAKLSSQEIKQAFNTHLTDYTFPTPYKLLDRTNPNSSPAVNYFKKTSLSAILYTINTPIENILVAQNAYKYWDSIVNILDVENDIHFNLTTYTANQSVETTFRLSALEEIKMRTDSNYRNTPLIRNVLRLLD